MVLDLRISHERWGSNSNPSLNGHLHYPVDIDRTLNETSTDKVLQYRPDFNNRPSHDISFLPDITSTSGRLHGEFVCLLFLQSHSSSLRSTNHILSKAAALRINLNIDGEPISFRSHTHPSHTQESRLSPIKLVSIVRCSRSLMYVRHLDPVTSSLSNVLFERIGICRVCMGRRENQENSDCTCC